MKLHPKQAALLKDLFPASGKSRVSARCANEVGKTRRILTAAILYAIEILDAQVISTAGVWMQVAQQLIPSLKQYAKLYPRWRFLDTSIKVDGIDRYVGFSARDEGFAQGFHKDQRRRLFACVDEAAAVDSTIIRSVEDRCNPDYFLVMGSPLDPIGAFYDIETKLSAHYSHHHLSQMDCLSSDGHWIDAADIERKIAKWGRDSQFVQSNVFGEFSKVVAGAIISLGEFDSAMQSLPPFNGERSDRHAFLDFAAGRAKNVFAVRVGNRTWIEKKWVDVNTMSACGEFLATFCKLHREYGLQPEEIDADADGLGGPMIDRLHEMGLKVNRFHGGSQPRFNAEYQNAIAEAWGEGAAKLKRKNVIVEPDEEFKGQALARQIKRNSSGKFQLESKEDMAKRSLPSPDEADAIFGAMMPKNMVEAKQVMGAREETRETKDSFWGNRGESELTQEEADSVIPGAYFG